VRSPHLRATARDFARLSYTLSSALTDPALEACHFPHHTLHATPVQSYQHLFNSSDIPSTAQYILCILLRRSALYQWNVEGLGDSIGSACPDFASGGSNDRRVSSGAKQGKPKRQPQTGQCTHCALSWSYQLHHSCGLCRQRSRLCFESIGTRPATIRVSHAVRSCRA